MDEIMKLKQKIGDIIFAYSGLITITLIIIASYLLITEGGL
jgi:hypothetical protein